MEPSNIKYFTLNDGVLELHPDKIVIVDKAKRNKLFETIGAICWIIYGTASIVRAFREGFGFSFYLGILLLIIWSFIIIKRIINKQTTNSEINLDDIITVTFKKSWLREVKIGKIKTRQNEMREISLATANTQHEEFEAELKRMNIVTTIK